MFILHDEQVLLIRKKRGFGMGKINGPGGKLDPGESELDCAIRETQEELHVTALNPVKRGELMFTFTDGLAMHVAVFMATQFEGTATETEEAFPLWTPIDAIPFEKMWQDDQYWLHRMLTTTADHFHGTFHFDSDTMLTHQVDWS
ncbi:8-oxo-dGTP diphosphatase [Phragmitibacter flavus]|uniref:Oxidized purine nucleoside triphosphate hydrolase n=2 Tax=Phragmitibacter flavus TaxID=2576071 RepID=A0A5R8KDL9_9BACT|nr:8-oxo-dGTP diphosphatase [Phragmitibacter flavus]